MSTLKEQLAEKRKEIAAKIAECQKEAQQVFNESIKELFAKHPKLESFSWTQYTPYFNDGDECTFSAQTDSLKVQFGGEEFDDIGTWTFKPPVSNEVLKAEGLSEACKDMAELMSVLEDEDCKVMWGDHVEVTVTKDGATAEEYDHD